MKYKHSVESTKLKVRCLGVTTFLSCFFAISTVSAQQSVNATGSNSSGSGGSASYSVGQLIYTTNVGANGSEAQGVQQPFEISVVLGTQESKNINLSAYPNPTIDFLTLSLSESYSSNFSYQLYDMQGKLLQTKKLTSKTTQINMSSYVTSVYFVKVMQDNKEIKTFKIIKK